MKDEGLDRLAREIMETIARVVHDFREERRWKGLEELSFDLSFAQTMLLMELEKAGSMSTGEMARNLRVTQGVITRMVDRLVEKGLVKRARNPEDRRVVILSLTEKGKKAASSIKEAQLRDIKGILRGIPEGERRDLLALLQKIRNHLDNRG